MSRHRSVRNMDISAELYEDDYYSDGGDDGMSPEDAAQMALSLERVKDIMGSEQQSGIPDSAVKEALWEYYFDIGQTVEWMEEEKKRMLAARERQDDPRLHIPTPLDFQGGLLRSTAGPNPSSAHRLAQARANINARASLPLIYRAQQQAQEEIAEEEEFNEEFEGEGGESEYAPQLTAKRSLTVISERTEQPTVDWNGSQRPLSQFSNGTINPKRSQLSLKAGEQARLSAHSARSAKGKERAVPGGAAQLAALPQFLTPENAMMFLNAHANSRPLSMMTSSTSDYGQVLNSHSGPINPDEIPPSPSLSALERMSILEDPPSAPSSEARSTPPMSPLAAMPPVETMPDIPDMASVISRQPAQSGLARMAHIAAPLDPRPEPKPESLVQPLVPPFVEPLVRLEDLELTPPAPSTAPSREPSVAAPSPKPSRSKLSALASSRASTYSQSSRSGTIETSSFVTYPALRPAAESFLSLRPDSELSSSEMGKSDTSSLVRMAIATAIKQESEEKTPSTSGTARVLRSQNTGSSGTLKPERKSSASSQAGQSVADSATGSQGSKVSKLAMLAQAKAAQQKGPWMPPPKQTKPPTTPALSELLHKTHTEYLTPVANGPTATTAITTSYQSLANLTPPSKSGLPPPMIEPVPTVPLVYSSAGGKSSKLASKAKRSSSQKHKHNASATPNDEELYYPPPELPVFLPRSNSKRSSRASPSAFASLLVNDITSPAGTAKEKDGGSSRSNSRRSRTSDKTVTQQRPTSKPLPPLPAFSSPASFAFDIPSPDDAVFEARRGTSLAQPRDSERSGHRQTPSASSLRSSAKSTR